MSIATKSKPSDTVLAHLNEVVKIHRLPVGARLPAAIDLAMELGISQGTVKNVYRRLAMEGKVRMRTGDGSFWIGEPTGGKRIYRVGINAEALPSERAASRWSYMIYGGMMQGKLAGDLSVQFRLCGELAFARDGSLEGGSPVLAEMDGVLLATSRPYVKDSIDYEGRVIPCIGLNAPHEDAVKNFVSPNYFTISRKLGEVWRKVGKKRILFLMSPAMQYSVSARLRCGGLLCGLEAGGGESEVRYATAVKGTEEYGYTAVKEVLAGGAWRPDAVYTAGDLLAFGAIRALEESGQNVPGDVSVVGGHGADCLKYPPLFLTSTAHGLENLGQEMLRLLIQRIDQHGADVPAYVEPSRFLIGTTTTEKENALLTENA